MGKKIAKGLWIPAKLAEEFDREVERLAELMPDKLETGEVGAAALLLFLRLPGDKQKLSAIKAAKNYVLDKVIASLHQESVSTVVGAKHTLGDILTQKK